MKANRPAIIGMALATAQLAVTATLAILALVVMQQGVPSSADRSISPAAFLLSNGIVYLALPLAIAFVASIVYLTRGRAASRATLAVGPVLLLASVACGAVAFRTWSSFGG